MKYKTGNLFDNVSSGIIVHGCNAKGLMGSGFAKEFRARFPAAYGQYVSDHDAGITPLGTISWYMPNTPNNKLALASAITQHSCGNSPKRYVSYDAVDTCFDEIFYNADRLTLDVHMPKIGAGLGGGDWEIIEAIINAQAKKHNISPDRVFVWLL